VARKLRGRGANGSVAAVAFLGSPFLTVEEAYLFAKLADAVGSPHRSVPVERGPSWTIPNLKGGITGTEAAPNRRGAELAGLTPGASNTLLDHDALLVGDGAAQCAVLVVCDSDFGQAAWTPETVAKLRRAPFLVVFGWADSPLAKAADVAFPVPAHAEKTGTYVNVEHRLQHFAAAFPPAGQDRPLVEVLLDLLGRFDASWSQLPVPAEPAVFARLAAEIPAFAGLSRETLPATGVALHRTDPSDPTDPTDPITAAPVPERE
jgi:NADH dehydrogenase/NADH:ubiquinone oxidoreductase subunit G